MSNINLINFFCMQAWQISSVSKLFGQATISTRGRTQVLLAGLLGHGYLLWQKGIEK